MNNKKAYLALQALLEELPAEFSSPPGDRYRTEFRVVKGSNVKKVHEALWTLQLYFDSLDAKFQRFL